MDRKVRRQSKSAVMEIISLRSSRGRVSFFFIASVLIYWVPISLLAGLSLWKRLDIPSPSIGLTRAYHYVLHGDLAMAWQQNRLIYIVLAIGLPIILKDAYNTLMLINKGK